MAVEQSSPETGAASSPLDRIVRFCLEQKLVVLLGVILLLAVGLRYMPFDPGPQVSRFIPRDPIPVDAIPDIGENQQVVFTEWPGRSPQDVENQVTYPLTTALQGTPGFKLIRGNSMFGFSSVYVMFEEGFDFYWCRARLLEKLSVARQSLPPGVSPQLGPDGTALGQVFWYTLEAPAGGFDLMELRSVQDWSVRYALQGVPGVSEVAGVGGYVREYQVDVDPDAMRAHGVKLADVLDAVSKANIDVGAETLEWNGVEYLVRGKGFIRSVQDIENIVLRVSDGTPLLVRHVAAVQIGPALRRGMLDKDGVEAVGGVVLVRYGTNPLEVIQRVKQRIAEITPSLPSKTLADGTISRIEIVPFYDRTVLINETLGTLSSALFEQVLVTAFVVMMFLRHLRSCVVISLTMPLAILVCFVLMKLTGVDSNLMSLGGIAIAIGTMVDMGIILTENIVRHMEEDRTGKPLIEIVFEASREISGAVTTAILMTVVSFLPVFALEGPEGKLFRPLAFTKTYALIGSLLVAIIVLPSLAHLLFARRNRRRASGIIVPLLFLAGGAAAVWYGWRFAGLAAMAFGAWSLLVPAAGDERSPRGIVRWWALLVNVAVMAALLVVLTQHWMPLGPGQGLMRNLLIVLAINLAWASVRVVFVDFYPYFLRLFLDHKIAFLSFPAALVLLGATIWLGFPTTFGWLPAPAANPPDGQATMYSRVYSWGVHEFPGLGREFMPPLDEGSFLLMPTLMPHTGIAAALDAISHQDRAIAAIPEIESVVGKLGRAETALDPAPVSMIETVILYKPEYKRDPATGKLATDEQGRPIRQWRENIRSVADIWAEIQKAAEFPGVTGAPHLQPIAARIVMLQSNMRAAMGVKVYGHELNEIERAGFAIADVIKQVPGVNAATVTPDRVVGKPYVEISIDRERMARYGVNIREVQDVIEIAIGGVRATTTVEGRERYGIRVRYAREMRDNIEAIGRIVVPAADGAQVPLTQLASLEYVRGPQEIKSEDNFLVAYVTFDKQPGFAEVDVVESCKALLEAKRASGEFEIPSSVHFKFAGTYENQVRFVQRLSFIVPISLLLLLVLLYFQFRSLAVSLIVFSGIPVAWAGGFIFLWLIGEPWFCNFAIFGENARTLLNFGVVNLSAAVWVGFIALFSVSTDDGVVLATYLGHEIKTRQAATAAEIRAAVLSAGVKRVRPCLMTSATTVLSLMPVLTSDGRGADVMIPIALPSIGGLSIELLSLFVLPVCYSAWAERRARAVPAG